MQSAGDKLTAKKKKLCENYIVYANATDAYRNAGYTTKSYQTIRTEGSRLLKRPDIQAYIQELMEEKNSALVAKQDEVLEFLTATMRNKDANMSDRIRSAELLGKRYATFVDKSQTEVSGDIEIVIVD